jgi:hypothetical protein
MDFDRRVAEGICALDSVNEEDFLPYAAGKHAIGIRRRRALVVI